MNVNALALRATVHCLTGCVIGEVAGMVIGTAAGFSNEATILLAVALAFVFGYALTMWPLLRSGSTFGAATRTAVGADTVSIVIMETIDNGFVLAVPGAMDAPIADALFWGPIALGFVIAFPFAYLANRYLIARGRGHVGAHGHHSG